jgi:hypothetical protein
MIAGTLAALASYAITRAIYKLVEANKKKKLFSFVLEWDVRKIFCKQPFDTK